MDRRSSGRVAREQLLRVQAVTHLLRPTVKPVILERKYLRMSTSPKPKPEPCQDIPTTSTTGSSTTSTVASLRTTAATATTASTTATATPATVRRSHAFSRTDLAQSSLVVSATVSQPPLSTSPPLPLSSAVVTATTTSVTRPIVGGKRTLGDESPIIILTQHPDGDNDDDDHDKDDQDQDKEETDLPESKTSKRIEKQELTVQVITKQDESTSKLSTGEQSSNTGKEGLGSKHGVQFSSPPPKRDVAHVMEFFQEQEKSLQESFFLLPKRSQKSRRSPSLQVQQSLGLEHLDNLIKLMEQLTSLKDENSRLRKRCDYLESTKVLLQARQDLSFESSSSSSGFMTLPAQRQKHHQHHQHLLHHHNHQDERHASDSAHLAARGGGAGGGGAGGGRWAQRPRLSSADELEYVEMADSSSDQRPRRVKAAMHKRSFSTGSLEVPFELLEEVVGVETRKRMKSKTGRSIFGGKASGSKQKSPKSSKWARVKKVLTGQKLYEDLGTTIKTLRDLGRSSQVRYPSGGAPSSPHDISPSSSRMSTSVEGRPIDTGEGDGTEPGGLQVPLTLASTSSSSLCTSSPPQGSSDVELVSDIWMGPPDWWEEYEASKENGASTASDVSSVIEVTTMYLGSKKDTTTSRISSSTPASSTAAGAAAQESYLTVDSSIPRRQSSPSLSDDVLDDLTISSEGPRILHKSSSCKSADLELSKGMELSLSPKLTEGREVKRFHKTAWGKVKDIIHTRKDSVKKKPKREKSGVESEETSEIDIEGLLEEQWRSDSFAEGLLSRSTPKTSPVVIRQQGPASMSESPPAPGALPKHPSSSKGGFAPSTSPGNVDMAALLAGSMSDEFNKKMLEWEEMKSKKSRSFRASIDESEVSSLDVSSVSQDVPVRTVDLRDFRGKVPDSASESLSPEESITSMEVLGAPTINVGEIQKRMTDSFSRKMLEWEKLKYKGSPGPLRDPSPDMERKGSKGRKDERQKSKRSREEKEKEKLERQRERDKQKVEREQVKLEKDKLRIEKERLRTLEREAKLEKLKGRLSQSDTDPSFKNPVLSPLAEYKVTADFARQLHEWELKKGLSHDVSNSVYLEAQKMSLQHLKEAGQPLHPLSKPEQVRFSLDRDPAEEGDETPSPQPLNLPLFWESPEEDTSPVEKYSEVSLGDGDTCTSVTEEYLTRSNIASLERANSQLIEELQKKELEYADVQEQVTKVNKKLAQVREEHSAEMSRFHRELAQGSITAPVKLEVGELENTMGDMEEKIKVLENFGEKLAMSMESAAVGKWQSIEGEETVHTQLMELVDQMRGMLVQATQSDEQSKKSMALSNFESLYSQAMKLQVQMNNLRLSHLERNREIMVIKRQLLLQEVNNLLLQADITRRETELYQFHEAKRFASLRRWNTFSGADRHKPQAQIELPTTSTKPASIRGAKGKPTDPRVNIPFVAENVALASSASSSLSAQATPLVKSEAGAARLPSSPSDSRVMGLGERSTDHKETHLLTPSLRKRETGIFRDERKTLFHIKEIEARESKTKTASTLQLPRAVVNLPARSSSREASSSSPSPTSPSSTIRTSLASTTKEKPPDPEEPPPPISSLSDSISGSTQLESSKHTLTFSDETIQQRSTKPEVTTLSDSAPLSREIEELKKAKDKVEKGSPTLRKTEAKDPSTVPSPVKDPTQRNTETPTQSIPKQRSLDKPRLTKAAPIIDDDYSPAQSVMECTDSQIVVESGPRQVNDQDVALAGGSSLLHPVVDTSRRDLPPTSDQSRAGSKSPRSPLSKHKLRRQRDDRDIKLKDYRAISPKGSPVAARGKPPLPRPSTPVRQSPSASPAADKGPRSKSVGDMEPRAPDSPTVKPLQDAINRFEKRATVCETEERPIELRKTPSPTFHLPRVGLVARVRRLKPAAELLEESQRYRSGHSIYATRIMQRYLPKDDRSSASQKTAVNKENTSGTYVHAIVQRLSRETTPVRSAGTSRRNSDLSLHRAEAARAQSEFVSNIVRKLSSSSTGPDSHKSIAPLKDLTNDGQVKKLAYAFNGSSEVTRADPSIQRQQDDISKSSSSKQLHRKSCEVAMVLSSSNQPLSEASYQLMEKSMSTESAMSEERSSDKPDLAVGPTNHKSLPILVTPRSPPISPLALEPSRSRAATYCVSEQDKKNNGADDEGFIPAPAEWAESSTKGSKSKLSSKEKKGEAGTLPPSSFSPGRSGPRRGKMWTVGVLCKQSISFDLGVSLYTQKSESEETAHKSRKPRSWDPSESARAEAAAAVAAGELELPSTSSSIAASSSPTASASADRAPTSRPLSSSSEGEVTSASPKTDEKKKSRRFLDSSWLQKSKKIFKFSK